MTLTLRAALGAVFTTVLIAGCTPKSPATTDAAPLRKGEVAATGDPDQIALSGHGEFFDAKMRRIAISDTALIAMQDSLVKRLANAPGEVDPRLSRLLALPALNRAEQFWLRAAWIKAKLEKRQDKDAQRMLLINDLLLQRSWRYERIRISDERLARLRELLGNLIIALRDTDYMRECREAGVPIPPDFATTGTAWQNQGPVVTNLLSPGEYAGVYTYHSPTVRGACVALPRGSGGPNSLMGIICQSATTGKACFWDNKLRSGGASAPSIGWAGITVKINELQDGNNLRENCTACHTGNNVYIVMPDDPTWGKLLRRSMVGTDHGNFTLRVRGGAATRYTPVSSQPTWSNPASGGGCAGSCHEAANGNAVGFWNTASPRPPMPPACASGGVGNCYVDPF